MPCAVILGWLLNGERMTMQKFAGTLIALLGVAIVIGLPEHKPPLVPTLLVIAGGVTWALGQVLAQKLSLDTGLGMLKGNAYVGVPQLAFASALFETGQWQSVATATPQQWLVLLFVIVFGFYLAYATWFALLKRVPMNTAAPFISVDDADWPCNSDGIPRRAHVGCAGRRRHRAVARSCHRQRLVVPRWKTAL